MFIPLFVRAIADGIRFNKDLQVKVVTLIGIRLHQLIMVGLLITLVSASIFFLMMSTLYVPSGAIIHEVWSSLGRKQVDVVTANRLLRSVVRSTSVGLDDHCQLFHLNWASQPLYMTSFCLTRTTLDMWLLISPLQPICFTIIEFYYPFFTICLKISLNRISILSMLFFTPDMFFQTLFMFFLAR